MGSKNQNLVKNFELYHVIAWGIKSYNNTAVVALSEITLLCLSGWKK